MFKLTPSDVVLFQGDSITDAGRNKSPDMSAFDLGRLGLGYATRIGAKLEADLPGLQAINRGVSGNRVPDLANRWQADCLDLKPTLLSILIGVNDTWHSTGKGQPPEVPLDMYETGYRDLLTQARTMNDQIKFVLCEPFVLRCGKVTDAFFPEIDQRRAVVQALAKEFHAAFVPFQSLFNELVKQRNPEYWAYDGVHPTLAGHDKMAQFWLKHVLA